MTDGAAGGPTGDPSASDAIRSAEQALSAAREAVAAVVTVRAKALQESRRLRDRAEAPGLAGLAEDAALQERRAVALEPRIEQLRDLARRAELALESLRSHRDEDPDPAHDRREDGR
ncbi:hypothetical protein [Patulibacter minatonensis]|uniref:hypothetical protein n=1 Tax=Patulibacter minatonensis TaxID=298163 RepID=UPI00047916EB|nr:hypothetical protein [Patulibacter minatonensis]